ncbi:hypothetical protein TSH100_10570 [Azospirillum sp. TSH100]|uniref:DUF1194 domain-containing protein n=1 Tax=Azospirillum sp. TSH100 TaxID=652764 RepID=UPI000D610C37|nr:DUF1194 domain-containing protein [Azospirillum sp. TSH100]PWC87226.1 hypothetical protein TSH100_10570 [Azospirillum sp. TSH100]QCG89992.1 DUF1194 domain-containing protein [Azospirillum sp. TSH100]
MPRAMIAALAVLLSLCGGVLAAPPAGKDGKAGVALVLALDGSASITTGDLEFQLQGHAAAFRDPAVADALAAAGTRVTLAVYSGPSSLRVLIPWTALDKPEDAGRFADRIDALPRGFQGDSTAIGSAIVEAAKLFDRDGKAPRQVIDIVSNGFSNSGIDAADARDRVTKRGIVVNGLAILDEFPWLEEYFEENVIGGPGSFAKSAMDKDSFVAALRQKLILEMVTLPDHMPSRSVATQ